MNALPDRPAAQAAVETLPAPARRSRRGAFLGVIAVMLAAVAGAAYWSSVGPYQESTEDAFVNGNVVAITSQVGGVVTAIAADDTDHVSAGTTLLQLDDVDAQLALQRAQAQLARTVRQVRAQYAGVGQARATVALREAELARARADLERRQQLEAGGAVSGEEVRHAQDAVHAAQAALALAGQQLAASQALVERTSVESHPDVLAAASQLRDAWIAARRTRVPAPVSGVVAKRSVQVGARIGPGVALMSVVPLDQLWVDANFKESQLSHIRAGQPVTLTADVYGKQVVYRGTVVGQDAGTGSAFSLLPAQNATGNWVKVVQRVPVRIALDPQELARHPLQLGLSMKVNVDTRERGGSRLALSGNGNAGRHTYSTPVFANELASADTLVRETIRANW